MADTITLTVGGRVHEGWTSATVETGLDSAADAFQLALTERWPGQTERWVIEAGAECQVSVGGEPIITGYIDVIEADKNDRSHEIRISGRSKTADLIDCATLVKPGSWTNRKLEAIATEIAAPFGVSVSAVADTGAVFKAFAIEPGETAFAAIERMTKLRGLLPVSTADGNLDIVTPVPVGEAIRLTEGVNIFAITARHNVAERFSEYLVKGQSRGDDDVNGRAAAHPKGKASDPGVMRYRPMLIVADGNVDAAMTVRRAEWEATVRAARAQEIEVSVSGFRTGGDTGPLWKKGQRVHLQSPSAWVDNEMIVSNVAWSIDDGGGRVTSLTCANPKAFAPEPVPAEARASRIGKAREART